MTKEKEAEKIQLVYEKTTRHIILQFESRIKTNRDLLMENLEKEKDQIRRINLTASTKRDNWKAEASANDQLERGKHQSLLMLEAFNIKSELTERLIESIYTRSFLEVTNKQMEEETELEKIRNENYN